jgi:hypothetical protein
MVTADYSPNRINFHIENNEMRDISIG